MLLSRATDTFVVIWEVTVKVVTIENLPLGRGRSLIKLETGNSFEVHCKIYHEMLGWIYTAIPKLYSFSDAVLSLFSNHFDFPV